MSEGPELATLLHLTLGGFCFLGCEFLSVALGSAKESLENAAFAEQ